MSVVFATLMAGCGKDKKHISGDVLFWSSFGSNYTNQLDAICMDLAEETGINLSHISQGSYDGIYDKTIPEITSLNGRYPNILTGYPNHFAFYQVNDVLLPLEEYVESYNDNHNADIMSDYFEEYVPENYGIDFDSNGNGYLMSLPFNKSTELMGYNGVFVAYCDYLCKNSLNGYTPTDALGTVPATWQQWEAKGPKYRAIMDNLIDAKTLYCDLTPEGVASNFSLTPRTSGEEPKLDFRAVDKDLTRVISWDSTDNMFITLVKQWGSEYTLLKDDQKREDILYRKGDIMFNRTDITPEGGNKSYRDRMYEAFDFYARLHEQHIFGVPGEFQQSYNSKAFENNQVMFMLCSSGGLSYNTGSTRNRFSVAPMPYYDDGTTVRKFVVSQGADIALTDWGDEEASFEIMAKLTTGDYQARWCVETGYYPCSKSAFNSSIYQEFLTSTDYSDPNLVAYREGSQINANYYKQDGAHANDGGKKWTKFADPAFPYSSDLRSEIKKVFPNINSRLETGMSQQDRYDVYASVISSTITNIGRISSLNFRFN